MASSQATLKGGLGAGKAALNNPRRAALGEIGNRANKVTTALGGKQSQSQQPLKPSRGLTRQKGSSSLLPLQVVTRRSAGKIREEQMELEQQQQQPMETENEEVGLTKENDVEMEELPKIDDIDEYDRENPQLAVEYVNEIYAYLRHLEKKMAVTENYLEVTGTRTSIKPKMRNLLIDWLIEVHLQFSLLQETLYLTVDIVDRFLQVKMATVSTKQLQLVGITAMFIASKYEEMYPPEIGDFVYISDNTYTAGQIRRMEISMMEALEFNFGKPLALNFLRRNSKAGGVESDTHGLAKYVMELCLVEYKMVHISPSLIAAASLAFAMRVLDPANSSLKDLWTPTIAHYSAYRVEALYEVVAMIAEVVLATNKLIYASKEDASSTSGKKKLQSVAKKYSNKKFHKVALLPHLRGEIVEEMSQGRGF